MAPATVVNGLAGPTRSMKKKAHTTSITRLAQPTSGSVRRARNLTTTPTVKPARISAHRMIEPSSAAHRVATL
jgi:hypothetical protein